MQKENLPERTSASLAVKQDNTNYLAKYKGFNEMDCLAARLQNKTTSMAEVARKAPHKMEEVNAIVAELLSKIQTSINPPDQMKVDKERLYRMAESITGLHRNLSIADFSAITNKAIKGEYGSLLRIDAVTFGSWCTQWFNLQSERAAEFHSTYRISQKFNDIALVAIDSYLTSSGEKITTDFEAIVTVMAQGPNYGKIGKIFLNTPIVGRKYEVRMCTDFKPHNTSNSKQAVVMNFDGPKTMCSSDEYVIHYHHERKRLQEGSQE